MARNVFYSFHYKPDGWRASQVRNMGVIEGNRPCSDNDWEAITLGGDAKITAWIDEQLKGKSCVLVLIGASTAGRKWIKHEIVRGWNLRKGVLGVHIHNLLNSAGQQSVKGSNPFATIKYDDQRRLSSIVRSYDPPYSASKNVYDHIRSNLSNWVEEAVSIRSRW